MFDLLEATHEGVKIRLAELRKKGELKAPTKEKTPNKILLFDSATEKELLAQLRKVSKDLAIIYESKGQFEEAIDICRSGIEYGRQWCLTVSEFENRTEKLKQKSRKVK